MKTTCKINPHILRYMEMVEAEEIPSCEDQKLLIEHVKKCFQEEDIYTKDEQLDKYLNLAKYFPYERVFEWEEFLLGLHLCTYKRSDGRPRWPDLLLLIGRGGGKDGYIALESFCLTSPYNPIRNYDVDICANAEEQSMRPVNDILEVLDSPKWNRKMRRHYYWTKEKVRGRKYGGTIKGRTNNPKSKDGMRSGMIAFNEIHQYPNYNNIKVFATSLGKRPHPRTLYATTNGDIRGGPLDDLLARASDILKAKIEDNGLLPFICRLDNKNEALRHECWGKANPSLRYLPELMDEMEKEFLLWKENPLANGDFMTKRMNLPQSASDIVVTDWENIADTNKELPDLTGMSCTCGIDYASVSDFASVNLHFRIGDIRIDINHSWLCAQSKELFRINAPWREWVEAGLLTLVENVEIPPDLLCEWIATKAQMYSIKIIGIDNFRYALFARALSEIGFDATDNKNIKLVRPSDIMKVVPVIDSCFNNHYFTWGDNPVLRWAANNTKKIRSGVKSGTDTGNYVFAKIEGKSRKTDPFMAVAHSMVIEDELPMNTGVYDNIPVIIG